MRNIRAIVVLVLAIIAGIVAVVLANRWVAQRTDQAGGAQVMVANRDLDLGTRLTAEMMKAVPWPKESVPQGSFSSPDKLVTRVVKTSVQRGEPILESKLAPIGTTGGLSSVIKEGSRAMTVKVNEIVGVAGFALPGNYVDILVNTEEGRSHNQSRQVSKIVLEHVLVLAVAQESNRDATKPRVVSAVTLEVTPEQAEKIDLARSVGSLTLVLRNQVDKSIAETEGANKKTLLAGLPVEPAPATKRRVRHRVIRKRAPAPPRMEQVEVIRGTTKSIEHFKSEE